MFLTTKNNIAMIALDIQVDPVAKRLKARAEQALNRRFESYPDLSKIAKKKNTG